MAVWWISFIIYPLWHLPASNSIRVLASIALFGVFVGCSYSFRFMTRMRIEWGRPPEEKRESVSFFVLVFILAFAAHVPFLFSPILTGLDTIDHASVPAVIAHKIVLGISGITGFSVQIPLTFIAVLTLLPILVSSRIRAKITDGYSRIAFWVENHFWATVAVLAVITAVYTAFILKFKPLDRFDDLNPLFRYPPLSKLISIPLYTFFGIHEWTGRVVQIAFTFGGSIYIYRLVRLYGDELAGRIAALLFVFLPPIFHYGNTTMIEGGTLFSIAAAFFYWIRFIEFKAQSDLVMGTIFATLACLYKHPGVSLIPAFAFMVSYDFLFPKSNRTGRYLLPSIVSCAIPAITIVLFMKLSGFNSDVPSSLQIPTLKYLWGNIQAIPKGITTPIALLFLAGIAALPFIHRVRTFWIFIAWIGAHYFLTCMSAAAMNVRQALPYYVGLIVPASLLLERCLEKQRPVRFGFAYVLLPGFLLWACLWMDRNQDFSQVGRAMGDRSYINFSNWGKMTLPYPDTLKYLEECSAPGDVVYAPMINEPLHFYIAKFHLDDRTFVREIWTNADRQSQESLLEHCKEIHAKWLIVPRGRWLYKPNVDP